MLRSGACAIVFPKTCPRKIRQTPVSPTASRILQTVFPADIAAKLRATSCMDLNQHSCADEKMPYTCWLVIFLTLDRILGIASFQPEFAEPIVNLTIPVGRDATFRCLVHHLGGYRVGWVKADTKAIQAIHDHLITHNSRVSVSHNDYTTWNLHIKNVQEEDRGQYMCQINTDPMKSQVGSLEVVVPPDFIPEETSGDITVAEGGMVKLTCRAKGHPTPLISWRREDGTDIILRERSGLKTKVTSYEAGILRLTKVSRAEMGAYMCIASNGVPPTVSKRITVNVHFHPVIHVRNQLVGSPIGTDVPLECNVEAFPKSINYWIRETGEMVMNSYKYDVQTIELSRFEVKMTVIVRNLQKEDVGSYRCIAKNSLGEVESNIRLYDIPGSTRTYIPLNEEDYNEQIGFAEREQEETLSNNILERGHVLTLTTLGTPRSTFEDIYGNHVPNDPAPNSCCITLPNLSYLLSLLVLLRI